MVENITYPKMEFVQTHKDSITSNQWPLSKPTCIKWKNENGDVLPSKFWDMT